MTVVKNKTYSIDKKSANETLKNVFAACDQTPNTLSFDYILFKNIANTKMVKVAKWCSLLLLLLIIISPLAFRNSEGNHTAKRSSVSVESHYIDDEKQCFVMKLSGEGVDYFGIYAKDEKGEIYVPLQVDEDNRTVFIPFTDGTINIYIPNEDGSVVQAVLSR